MLLRIRGHSQGRSLRLAYWSRREILPYLALQTQLGGIPVPGDRLKKSGSPTIFFHGYYDTLYFPTWILPISNVSLLSNPDLSSSICPKLLCLCPADLDVSYHEFIRISTSTRHSLSSKTLTMEYTLERLKIEQIVVTERYARDTSQWDKLRSFWHPDNSQTSLKISWFSGTIDKYVTDIRTTSGLSTSPVSYLIPYSLFPFSCYLPY